MQDYKYIQMKAEKNNLSECERKHLLSILIHFDYLGEVF